MRQTNRHVFAVVALVLTACSGNDSTPASTEPGSVSRLTLALSSETDTIPEATSKLLTARVTDQSGLLMSASITWSSTDPGIASVANGFVTGVSRGVASIIASTAGAADTALIVVTENDLTLDVQPSAAAVAMGDTINFVATIRTRAGDVVHVNSFNWSLSDTSAAELVGAGSLYTKHEAELSVSAEALARQGSSTVKIFKTPVASVTLTPSTANVYKGSSLTLIAVLRDHNGRLVEDKITWGSSDYTKASVTQDGLVTGVGVGSVVITATADSRTGSATINVLGPPAAAVDLTLPSPTLPVGSEMQATAIPIDSSGAPVSGKTIGWQSANPFIATVTSTGKVKGIAIGNVNVSAIVDGVVASQRLSVTGRTPTSVVISPSAPTVSAGQQSQLIAQVLDQTGVEIVGQPVSWTSSNAGVATISSTGMLQGVASGSTVVSATSGMLTASVTATVVNTQVASVRVSPVSTSLTAGGQATLVAEALDASQNVLLGRVVTWSSQNPTVATVTNLGLVTAIASGSTNLVATIEGRSANAAVTVSSAPLAPVAAVAVTLANSVLNVGGQTQATATLTDASGNTLTGRQVTWFSLDSTVAKVSSSGLVTASGGGTVAIVAQSGSASGSASLSVNTPTAAPVARVTMSVPTQDLQVGQSIQAVITLYDASGNVLTGRTITYTSDNPAVITVSATGVIKAVGVGSTKMRATSGGITTLETFRVTSPVVLTSIAVSPATSTLAAGESIQAGAVAKDAQGAPVAGTSFTWTTSNAAVATVSGSGLVSAVGAGSATISAAASGVTGSMAVTVLPPAPSTATVATVNVSLSPSNVVVDGTSQATAVAKDAQGAIITGKSASWSVGGSLLASVSSSGVVTGLQAGTVPVTATVDGISASASLTIASPLPPPPASTVVELPRVLLSFAYPTPLRSVSVPAGANLQTALNAALPGDELILLAGATYTGNFTASTCGAGWITVRSGGTIPAGRMTPTKAAPLAKLVSPNTAPALRATGCKLWLSGIEVTITAAATASYPNYGLLLLEGTDQVLDRVYVHGQPTSNLIRCVTMNGARQQVSSSWISDCHANGYDSQAIQGGNGTGPFKIVDNTLEAAGENLMFGGSDPSIPGLVPSDIEIRGNHVHKPLTWQTANWTVKNLMEFKNAVRVLVEGNVLDGSWYENGGSIIVKSSNQSGGCRWCRSTDVTIRRNLITNAGQGIAVAGSVNSDSTTKRVLISENVLDLSQPGTRQGLILLSPQSVSVVRNVFSGTTHSAAIVEGGAPCVFDSNIWSKGSYGVFASGAGSGTAALNKGCGTTGWTWTAMTLIGSSGSGYPGGTTWAATESVAPLASQIRSLVTQAVAGVVVTP